MDDKPEHVKIRERAEEANRKHNERLLEAERRAKQYFKEKGLDKSDDPRSQRIDKVIIFIIAAVFVGYLVLSFMFPGNVPEECYRSTIADDRFNPRC